MKSFPTEPIGSIPRPHRLVRALGRGELDERALEPLFDIAVRDTIARFEEVGSPVVTDGEQRKHRSFLTYPVEGGEGLAPDGFLIPFRCGRTRRIPKLVRGPFRYKTCAYEHLERAQVHANVPVKQAVISPSALSLLYPEDEIRGYPREQFIEDLLAEHERDVRGCLARGAHTVQIDFMEARLAVKLDATGGLLHRFIDLNNLALARFSAQERMRIGVHACAGGDRDSTHAADVDYAELLPSLFELDVGRFYVALAAEKDRRRVLEIIGAHRKPHHTVFVGVVSPIDQRVETEEEVCMRVIEASRYIPLSHLGTTEDGGFAPFSDDVSLSRDVAFEKVRARVRGTRLAFERLSGRAA